ncbi:MAG TPA: tetratricopeptide repeat-containing glycosyltransferase family protein [Stellaceae bacterium]|nr:tetratricopeptide repeat-containing glycosyltransferase family protein [Stellaceae bacterium]
MTPAFDDPTPTPAIAPGAAAAPSAAERAAQLIARATEHEQAGRLEAAESTLAELLALMPDHAGGLHLSGIVAFKLGRPAEAARRMERSIARAGATGLYHRNLCEVYRILGRYDEALAAGRRAVRLSPEDPHAHNNLGVTHYHRLELDAAIACAGRALALDPDFASAHFGMAEALLLRGDFAPGWDHYEWRFKLANVPRLMPPTDRPQWDGAPLARGTLLLIADQGYGDVIQFARYIPWAAARCPDIALACSTEIQPIVTQQPGGGKVFARWDQRPDFAAFCPLSGLPRLAGTRLATIPADIPYLRADPRKGALWAERIAALAPRGYRRIGLVWAGRPTHNNDRNRSIALAALAPLAQLPRTALIALQKGAAQAQIGTYWGRAPLVNLGPEIADYADTMAVLDSLDLVVTVDTSVAHLAGAMGKPVWILLPFAPDWRWLLQREDSPWYPTARLFRQLAPGRWAPVIGAVAAELAG